MWSRILVPKYVFQISTFISPTNSVSLLKFRLSQIGRTAVDVGRGGGGCVFRAVSQQLYGIPKNHFYVQSVGIQYLVNHPEQFTESNTEHSWQGYMERMSCQGMLWFKLLLIVLIYLFILLSQIQHWTSECYKCPKHLHWTSSWISLCVHRRKHNNAARRKQQTKKIADKDKPVVDHKKPEACRRKYMREYMKARQADDNLRKNENKKTSARQQHW